MTQDVNPYDAVIADLEGKRDQLTGMIESLKQMRNVAAQLPVVGVNSSIRSAAEADFAHDAFFGMTIPDAAKKYLAAVRKTMPLGALGEALLAGGIKTTSKNFTENIRAILSRQPEFVRINGEFGLAEWYPGRGATRRPRRAGDGGEREPLADTTADSAEPPTDDEEERVTTGA